MRDAAGFATKIGQFPNLANEIGFQRSGGRELLIKRRALDCISVSEAWKSMES
jgi:hypothetical protein